MSYQTSQSATSQQVIMAIKRLKRENDLIKINLVAGVIVQVSLCNVPEFDIGDGDYVFNRVVKLQDEYALIKLKTSLEEICHLTKTPNPLAPPPPQNIIYQSPAKTCS